MQQQKWLTLGISAAIASVIASVILASNKPANIIAASALGALGGVFLTHSRTTQASRLERLTLANENLNQTLDRLEKILHENNQEIATLKDKIEQPKPKLITTATDPKIHKLEDLLHKNYTEIANLKQKIEQPQNSLLPTAKNVAILYDIENLLKGYNMPRNILKKISLREILETIQKSPLVDTIAIQQAYANWSDGRLRLLRTELNELGIQPMQIFGFSYEPIKNAADIQLVIDAIDLAYLRSKINIFVIVSGDGGFAALAKKLHEYGKTVIGCAYQNSTSKIFRSVCDDFIWIPDPEETAPETPPIVDRPEVKPKPTLSKNNGLDNLTNRLVSDIEPEEASLNDNFAAVIAKTKEILNWYANDQSSRSKLMSKGIYSSTFKEATKRILPNLNPLEIGFVKFIEYMQYVCKETELCVARIPPSDIVLVLRDSPQSDATILPDLDTREVHSLETYQVILATGSPLFRLASPLETLEVASWIIENPIEQKDIGEATAMVFQGLNETVSENAVKQTLLSFNSAGILQAESEDVSRSERKLSLQHEQYDSVDKILRDLRKAIQDKIERTLSSTQDEILNQILPAIAPSE
ncbi:MAG: NYN domain-containing protein [Jaaginema sp. PMC 1079.18]|nr:NYN domain-containing protein [Jaaginema sp. PMC 1080.18]MEC4851578.1 NYN domain-containing protein [Jaaginema sp. PMC 1079.18]MEC4866738.1 NYN domain-containing protein [Jaaginema sp. PMC 1078.18]